MPSIKKEPASAGKPSRQNAKSGAASTKAAGTASRQKSAAGVKPAAPPKADGAQAGDIAKQAKAAPAKQENPAKQVEQAASKSAATPKEKGKPSKEKPKKAKLVRDSFTMPDNEYQVIGDIKKACLKSGFAIKKSELLRIGVALLQKMPAAQIQQALSALPALKAGRPKKS